MKRTPSGDRRFTEEALPVWADHGTRFMYGIPGNEWRGFKVADDTRGPAFDPTGGERAPSPEGIQRARDYVAFRFPGLKGAPLLEARDRKSTRLNSSHGYISYAVFCLKKKKK